ncbi:trypsin-like peptidase domain-containing protein [Sorangium sp. So ce367]|uniref:S1 family peptidase n=1 Tax=Sorangium sp. So ce367 TaxID=3133305 RepID=UPI003F618FC2
MSACHLSDAVSTLRRRVALAAFPPRPHGNVIDSRERAGTMPVNDAQKRAIARLTASIVTRDGPKPSRGTGFLVRQDGLMLTAFHAVGDLSRGVPTAAPIRVEFAEPGARPAFSTTATLVRSSVKDDWALLRCEKVPDNVAAFTLAPLCPGFEVGWSSFGFSEAAMDLGMVYEGKIRSFGLRIQLFAEEATATEGSRIRGLSGGPCLVDGFAVGIIQTANMKEVSKGVFEVREGAVFTLPLSALAEACQDELSIRGRRPPFVPEVAQLLTPADPLLRGAAEILKFPDPSAVARAALAERVAEEMMRGGIEPTRKALEAVVLGLSLKNAVQILDFAGSLWIHERAAEHLARVVACKDEKKAIFINASRPDTVLRFVHRAGYPTVKHPGWTSHFQTVPSTLPEPLLDGLAREVRRLLLHQFTCNDDELDDEIAEHPHDAKPIVIVIPPPLPTATVLAALQDLFPQIRFALLAGEVITDEARAISRDTGAEIIEPLIAAGHEEQARKAHARARKLLQASHEAAHRTSEETRP